jgi:hypothetical protein
MWIFGYVESDTRNDAIARPNIVEDASFYTKWLRLPDIVADNLSKYLS